MGWFSICVPVIAQILILEDPRNWLCVNLRTFVLYSSVSQTRIHSAYLGSPLLFRVCFCVHPRGTTLYVFCVYHLPKSVTSLPPGTRLFLFCLQINNQTETSTLWVADFSCLVKSQWISFQCRPRPHNWRGVCVVAVLMCCIQSAYCLSEKADNQSVGNHTHGQSVTGGNEEEEEIVQTSRSPYSPILLIQKLRLCREFYVCWPDLRRNDHPKFSLFYTTCR